MLAMHASRAKALDLEWRQPTASVFQRGEDESPPSPPRRLQVFLGGADVQQRSTSPRFGLLDLSGPIWIKKIQRAIPPDPVVPNLSR